MEFAHPLEIRAKRVRLAAILSFVLLLIGFVIYLGWPKEPIYHFRTLTSWLEDYVNPLRDVHNAADLRQSDVRNRQLKACDAVLAIGTNAVPTLLKYAGARGAGAESANRPANSGEFLATVNLMPASELHSLARAGFMILQSHAAPALPGLIKLTHDQDAAVRMFASESIIMVAGTDPKVLIPVYVQFGHDPDAANRRQAAQLLHTMLLMADDSQKASIYEAFPELRDSSPKTR